VEQASLVPTGVRKAPKLVHIGEEENLWPHQESNSYILVIQLIP